MRLLVGSSVRLLVGKPYHTKQKDGYSLQTNSELTHTLLQRTFYSKGTLCIVKSCSKEQFASNWVHCTLIILLHRDLYN